jgi:hypothetical protein
MLYNSAGTWNIHHFSLTALGDLIMVSAFNILWRGASDWQPAGAEDIIIRW